MMDEREKSGQSAIVIEGNERLRADQNFYDQQPFQHIHKGILSRMPELSLPSVRAATRYAAEALARFEFWNGIAEQEGENIMEIRRAMAVGDKIRTGIKGGEVVLDRHKSELLAEVLLNQLQQFTYLVEYTLSQGKSEYLINGDVSRKVKKVIEPESYVSWVSKRLRAESNATLLGIEEIFPQYFGEQINTQEPKRIRVKLRR